MRARARGSGIRVVGREFEKAEPWGSKAAGREWVEGGQGRGHRPWGRVSAPKPL